MDELNGTDDIYHLARFVEAQSGIYERALDEIRQGRKTSHWMWFIFPQIEGLGRSPMAQRYSIRSLAEARAYLAHPLLGPRLRACAAALQALGRTSADAVFGPVDAMKLRSSLTLFAAAAPDERVFAAALDRWFEGQPDEQTLRGLKAQPRASSAPGRRS